MAISLPKRKGVLAIDPAMGPDVRPAETRRLRPPLPPSVVTEDEDPHSTLQTCSIAPICCFVFFVADRLPTPPFVFFWKGWGHIRYVYCFSLLGRNVSLKEVLLVEDLLLGPWTNCFGLQPKQTSSEAQGEDRDWVFPFYCFFFLGGEGGRSSEVSE